MATEAPKPKEGGGFVSELAADGRVLRRVHYRYVELEPGRMSAQADGSSDTLLLIPTNVEELDAAVTEIAGPVATLSEAELQAFLADVWDPYVDGKDDPGVNAKEFLELLTELDLEPASFITVWKQVGLSLDDLTTFLRAFRDVAEQYAASSADEYDELALADGDLVAKAAAQVNLADPAPLSNAQDLDDWAARIRLPRVDQSGSQKTQAAARSGPTFAAQKANVDPAKLIGVVLDVAKFGWQVIKDNAPVVNTNSKEGRTHVLHASDRNPLSYHGARDFQSRTFQFRLVDATIPSLVFVDLALTINGSYGAQHATKPGRYLPAIYPHFRTVNVNFPAYANAWCNVEGISNVGTAATPNPQIVLSTTVEYGWLFQKFRRTIAVTLRGDRGIYRQ